MSPVTHLFAGWLVAARTTDNDRDRRLVALAGVLPDLDGLGLLVDWARQAAGWGEGFYFYQRYHHFLLHGIAGALLLAGWLTVVARRRGRVFLLALALVHLHLLCDLVGSRGPDPEDFWPIHYLAPFSHAGTWIWPGQWGLDAWPNQVITVLLMGGILGVAVNSGYSVVGVFSARADRVFVATVRGWWCRWRGRRPSRAGARSSSRR